MGATSKYGLAWPDVTGFVRAGATAMRELAETVEAALLPPLLVTDGTEEPNYGTDKTGEVGWDVTDSPDRRRGEWDSGGGVERLVIPSLPGWYFVSTSVRFAGKAEPDWYEVQIRTRKLGDDYTTGTMWAQQRIELPANSASYTQLNAAGIVRVGATAPRTGISVRAAFGGSAQAPTGNPGANKLRIYRLSAL